VQLVPATSFGQNLRALLTAAQWDTLRRQVYRAARYRCDVCGGRGPDHPVECHEYWAYYDETHVQRLDRLVALCPDCHEVAHIGHARTKGRDRAARNHLAEVNGWTGSQVDGHLSRAFATWERRSRHDWRLDLGVLRAYGIEPPTQLGLPVSD
jgi:hypothetical protein